MTRPVKSLRTTTNLLLVCAVVIGGFVVWLWAKSNAEWRGFQDQAYIAGIVFYDGLQNGTVPAHAIDVRPLSPADQAHASAGQFSRIANAPTAARITNVPISGDVTANGVAPQLSLVIMSPDIVYRIADLPSATDQTAAETTGEVFRKLASFCSDPVVIAQRGDADWLRVDGAEVWGCDASPADFRLLAVFVAVVGGAILLTATHNMSVVFASFADKLRNRRRVGGPEKYQTPGPQELQDIVDAVNTYLETERSQLEGRAAVLSGVSHDLGTPATRLRLRAALIPDQELRRKLEADIDTMTGMIESVLSYTRAEMNTEAPRALSMTALVEAIVANYEDMGQPVTFAQTRETVVLGGSSVFMSRQGQATVTGERTVTVTGRPIALERAIGNLIDNALKYGRRATVSLETDAQTATVVVEDEGARNSAQDIEDLIAPYKRGENTAAIEGYGLGLTIVATIADLHGGSLSFLDTDKGVAARLIIQRA